MNGASTVNIQVGDASGNANQMAIAFKDWGADVGVTARWVWLLMRRHLP